MGSGELDGVVHQGVELELRAAAGAVAAGGGEDRRGVGAHAAHPRWGCGKARGRVAGPRQGGCMDDVGMPWGAADVDGWPSVPGSPDRPAEGEVPEAPDVPGFELGELLARGGTSEVWAGVAVADGRRVAVKVVHAALGAVEAAAREASVSAQVASAHVVPVEGCVELADGRLAVVMPHLRGGSLDRLVQARGHLAPGEVVTVLAPVASALGPPARPRRRPRRRLTRQRPARPRRPSAARRPRARPRPRRGLAGGVGHRGVRRARGAPRRATPARHPTSTPSVRSAGCASPGRCRALRGCGHGSLTSRWPGRGPSRSCGCSTRRSTPTRRAAPAPTSSRGPCSTWPRPSPSTSCAGVTR